MRDLKASILLILFGLLFSSTHVRAQVDLKGFDLDFTAPFRTYALSGILQGTLGYSYVAWGNEKPWMGFVRLAGEGGAAPGYLSRGLVAEIFPVSLLGFRYGQTAVENHEDYHNYNCPSTYLCRGYFSYYYYEVPLYLGYESILFAGSYRREVWEHDESGPLGVRTEYIEPTSGMNFDIATSDFVERVRGALFYKYDDNWRFGYVHTHYWAKDLNRANHSSNATDRHMTMRLAGIQYVGEPGFFSGDKFSAFAGIGTYGSHILDTRFTALVVISYSPLVKVGY